VTKTEPFGPWTEDQYPPTLYSLLQDTHSLLTMETLTTLLGNTKPWGDMLYEDEQNRKLALLRMPQPEWLACVNAYFNRLRGNGAALISALAWFQQMEAERVAFQAPPAPAPEMDEATRNWRVWQDMVEEPWKYGSDIGEWLEIDESLRRGPKRWRVDAYWNAKVREMEAEEQEAAATKIQAAWRGHNLRYVLGPRFNCACCLKRELCWTPWEDRMHWLCGECSREWAVSLRVLAEEEEREAELEELRRQCDAENLGEEEICADCGEEIVMYAAKVGPDWFCAACIHDWTECPRCDRAMRLGGRCDNHCLECGDELTGLGQTNGFCSGDCHYAWERGSYM
jgi:hypothetical protein